MSRHQLIEVWVIGTKEKEWIKMDYIFDGIIIVFVIACIVFIYNALKIQHGSNHFPTPKDDSEKKENDK